MGNMRHSIQGLDWKSPLLQINLYVHWRVWVGIVACVVVAVTAWHYQFPHADWFPKFWCGGATGGFVGLILGYVWQFKDEKRMSKSSGKLLIVAGIAWGSFCIIALGFEAGNMKRAEITRTTIRSLTVDKIKRVDLFYPGQHVRKLDKSDDIASFIRLTKKAELFYPSHEPSKLEFRLHLVLTDGTILDYPARIPERHVHDISLEFPVSNEIRIPEGRLWLDSVVKEQKD